MRTEVSLNEARALQAGRLTPQQLQAKYIADGNTEGLALLTKFAVDSDPINSLEEVAARLTDRVVQDPSMFTSEIENQLLSLAELKRAFKLTIQPLDIIERGLMAGYQAAPAGTLTPAEQASLEQFLAREKATKSQAKPDISGLSGKSPDDIIPVKVKATGVTGEVKRSEFDPAIFDEIK